MFALCRWRIYGFNAQLLNNTLSHRRQALANSLQNRTMAGHAAAGDLGEREVVQLVPCPNCGKKLMQLPKNYPMYDVQCTGCSFRAQVKTNKSKPRDEIFGAGWDIVEKVMKAGFTIPPLIAHFKWVQKGATCQQIVFYPFIPRDNLRKRQLSATARRANYKMFNYVGLSTLPHFVLLDTSATDGDAKSRA